jgi:hypothetical protein
LLLGLAKKESMLLVNSGGKNLGTILPIEEKDRLTMGRVEERGL